VSAYGCGLVGGSLFGARDAGWTGLRRRYLSGLGLMSLGLAGSAVAPALGLAMLTFAVTGAGNGLFLVSDRVMLQRLVPERLQGRAFGLLDSIDSWGFGAALLAGGLIATTACAEHHRHDHDHDHDHDRERSTPCPSAPDEPPSSPPTPTEEHTMPMRPPLLPAPVGTVVRISTCR
jgi:hypothetical protein